jgi:hypothetical protein
MLRYANTSTSRKAPSGRDATATEPKRWLLERKKEVTKKGAELLRT